MGQRAEVNDPWMLTSVIHSRIELHHNGSSDDLLQEVAGGLLSAHDDNCNREAFRDSTKVSEIAKLNYSRDTCSSY